MYVFNSIFRFTEYMAIHFNFPHTYIFCSFPFFCISTFQLFTIRYLKCKKKQNSMTSNKQTNE
ncbi:hypothetical protein DERF_008637 [Dermatophagoides farinae]|uniref:Uncharacterized protein n=1 Tax=Dermatophagoides farinae TaxID=6954 RepID=A0A922I0C2_DERFA|nr:hypothetical protein DERF_008637 [Dermatophagoides farinae]